MAEQHQVIPLVPFTRFALAHTSHDHTRIGVVEDQGGVVDQGAGPLF